MLTLIKWCVKGFEEAASRLKAHSSATISRLMAAVIQLEVFETKEIIKKKKRNLDQS